MSVDVKIVPFGEQYKILIFAEGLSAEREAQAIVSAMQKVAETSGWVYEVLETPHVEEQL